MLEVFLQVTLYKNVSCNRELSNMVVLNVVLVIDRKKFPNLIGLPFLKYALQLAIINVHSTRAGLQNILLCLYSSSEVAWDLN
jgi:hypothetical protein